MKPVDPNEPDPVQRFFDTWGQQSAEPFPNQLKNAMRQRLSKNRDSGSYPAFALAVGCIALACSLSLWWIVPEPLASTARAPLPTEPELAPVPPDASHLPSPVMYGTEQWLTEAERQSLRIDAIQLEIRLARLESLYADTRARIKHRIAKDRLISSANHNLLILEGFDAP